MLPALPAASEPTARRLLTHSLVGRCALRGTYRVGSITAASDTSCSGETPMLGIFHSHTVAHRPTTYRQDFPLFFCRSRPPASLPLDPLLVLCAEGLRETVHPHNFVAPSAFFELCQCEGSAAQVRKASTLWRLLWQWRMLWRLLRQPLPRACRFSHCYISSRRRSAWHS